MSAEMIKMATRSNKILKRHVSARHSQIDEHPLSHIAAQIAPRTVQGADSDNIEIPVKYEITRLTILYCGNNEERAKSRERPTSR